ncbi:MAG: endonuclease III [Oscillospiraceae bacterium]|nr:endonuclease III [Oscillospiraceae bacterium]
MAADKTTKILKILDTHYPYDGICFLHYNEPWQLLIATILSAQCTDERVNQVTAVLFQKYTTIQALAEADFAVLSNDIRSTGFFNTKAKHIIESAAQLLHLHNGQLPSDIDSLTALPGVGRKTANVVRGHIFGIPSITVDTHVKRVSFKLGLTKHTDPEKIEFELMKTLPEAHWIQYNQQIITHGRRVCTARSPQCGKCPLAGLCESAKHPLG